MVILSNHQFRELVAAVETAQSIISKFVSLLYPLRDELRKMGVSDKAKLLPPQAVLYVCRKLNITALEK